jgi:ABC-type amino acid transport substrate-binding protein
MLPATILLLAAACAQAQEASGSKVFELEPEYVYGKNRGPRLGYRKPEVFEPLSDIIARAGYKDYPPTEIPEELKHVDALTRVQKMGRIMACADGWFWPFSRTAHNNEPPGIEIELLQTIAKKNNWELSISWVNMATRFGPGAPGGAYSRSINKGICDLVTGLTISGDDHHNAAQQLDFTRPFMSTGYVLVTQGPAKPAKTLEDLKALGLKVGVPAYSPMSEYAQAHGIAHETFFQNFHIIEALVKHQIDAAMIWSGSVSQAKLNHPEAEFDMVKGFEPPPEMRWNSAWVVKTRETDFKKFIDEAFEEMLKSGEIKRIVERYGMPFYPPVGEEQ